MEQRGQHIAIIVAIIGVIGTIGAALLQNWDKIAGRPPAAATSAAPAAPGARTGAAAAATAVEPAAAAPATAIPGDEEDAAFADDVDIEEDAGPNGLGGVWRELYPNPGNLTHTTMNGNRFEFTTRGMALGVPFEAYGTGILRGARFESTYQSNLPSTGVCGGSVSAGGTRMNSVCLDSAYGRFEAASVRE